MKANTVLLVPQLAMLKRISDIGRFSNESVFMAFIEDALKRLGAMLELPLNFSAFEAVTLVAHSAGYKGVSTVLAFPRFEPKVMQVVLFDALYAGAPEFASWANKNDLRRLVSFYTGRATTYKNHVTLQRLLSVTKLQTTSSKDLRAITEGVKQNRIYLAKTTVGHGSIPSVLFTVALRGLFKN